MLSNYLMPLICFLVFILILSKKCRKFLLRPLCIVILVWLIVWLIKKTQGWLTRKLETLLNLKNTSFDGYEDYVLPLVLIVIAITIWYFWKPIKEQFSKISKPSWSSKKINVWKILGWILVLSSFLSLCWWVYEKATQPKEQVSYNFTQKDYDATYAQPSNGGEGFHLGKKPHKGSKEKEYETISFKEDTTAKKGVPFYIKSDGVGQVFVPHDENVWRTITRKNVEYPNEYITFTSMRRGGNLYVKNFSQSEIRHEGVWEVVVDADMTFALRSESDDRVQIVMQ